LIKNIRPMSGHHSLNIKVLFGVAGYLFVMTALTVAVAYIHIPAPWNIVVAMGIAVAKAAAVVLFFMNLYYDEKFNSLTFIISVLFLLIFVGITMLDTMFRNDVVPTF